MYEHILRVQNVSPETTETYVGVSGDNDSPISTDKRTYYTYSQHEPTARPIYTEHSIILSTNKHDRSHCETMYSDPPDPPQLPGSGARERKSY